MTTTDAESVCHHPANDLIEAVAFGFASDAETHSLMEHIATCEACAATLEEARFAAQVLPLSLQETDLPESVWVGIERRLQSEDQAPLSSLESPVASVRSSARGVYWTVAALIAVLALAAGVLLGRTVLEPGPDPDTDLVAQVTITDPQIEASGSVHYLPEQGVILLDLERLPPAEAGYVYQVWMIAGDTPISMGVFDPATSRFAAAGNPNDFDAMAITVEQGPLGSAQPTTDPLVVADLQPLQTN